MKHDLSEQQIFPPGDIITIQAEYVKIKGIAACRVPGVHTHWVWPIKDDQAVWQGVAGDRKRHGLNPLMSEQRLQPESFTSRCFPWLLEKIERYNKKYSGFEFRNNSAMTKAAFLGKLITDSNFFFFCLLHFWEHEENET